MGARGFVGSGVVRLLREREHNPHELDLGDDLRRLRDVEVVLSTTGRPGLLTAEHLHPGHRLVIDSGFVPHPDRPRGDVHPAAQHLPAAITPVPGGVGPVEMAVLAERIIATRAAPDLAPWRYYRPPPPTTGSELSADEVRPPPRLTNAHRTVEREITARRRMAHDPDSPGDTVDRPTRAPTAARPRRTSPRTTATPPARPAAPRPGRGGAPTAGAGP